jgi:NAD-dependent deacetylase
MGDMSDMRNIVILTGAGISAESGLRTFRADDGLWEDHPVEQVATPQGFRRDPDLVQRFYDERRAQVRAANPNAAHLALGRLDTAWKRGELLIVTQNIDDLHERGGAARVLHMHGEALSAWCTNCDARHRWMGTLRDNPPCPACGQVALRPDIVWFGEMPYQMERIYRAIAGCDLFVSIGTSGAVYPAAGLVQEAGRAGARTLELNLEESLGSRMFSETRLGKASEIVPAWVAEMLGA